MSKDMNLTGKEYWLSLDQAPDSKEYRKYILEQYHDGDHNRPDHLNRRNFLSLMGASIALASLSGCRRPVEKIIPYVNQPEGVIPGIARHYATSIPFGNSAYGLIVENHEGRPTKIEGNPDHPLTLGASNALIQASILGLYDPDRSRAVKHNGADSNHDEFVSFWREKIEAFKAIKGAGLGILSEPFCSPTLARYKEDILEFFPEVKWITWGPIGDESIYRAVEDLTGKSLRPIYHFDQAHVILALDSDFLYAESENIKAAMGFADGRRLGDSNKTMNRLYAVENAFSITGGMADHRLRVRSGEIGEFAIALAQILKQLGLMLGDIPDHNNQNFDKKWLGALARDLIKSRGKSLLVAGSRQPEWVHELVFTLNDALGNLGQTIDFVKIEDSSLPDNNDLQNLMDQMSNGAVNTLVILGGNPVYDAFDDLNFEDALKHVKHTVHFSEYLDETSRHVEWHIPRAHYLESWGDVRSADGTVGVIQPMIEPLFGGYADSEFYALLATGRDRRGYDIVRETWRKIINHDDFEKEWRKVLHNGLLKGSSSSKVKAKPKKSVRDIIKTASLENEIASADNLEINFYPSQLYDGRYANNGWLQELPDPVSKIAWDNAVLINPETANKLGLKNTDMVRIEFDGRRLEMPVWISPGQAAFTIGLALGYGREQAGQVARGVGFNTYKLRTTRICYFGHGAKLTRMDKTYKIANTQDHNSMEGRPIIREATLEEYRMNPEFAAEMVEHPPLKSIYKDHDYSKGYQWGMVIDLNTCIGCNACTIACQSENNIPIVGKEQVVNGREMHWIRNDRYYAGNAENPEMVHMPVACQQCENAPCESVCPVAATLHDKEGLNLMIYNRCIGTRYCSNNCPYKVRRFNFFNYTKDKDEVEKMNQNPDVTVRSRGVMEKCTFCIQRINRAKLKAKGEGRKVADGEIIAACQQACPTQAIQFGDINDPDSKVSKQKRINRNYELLAELNIRPRNSYLAKIRNPNPELINYKIKES